MRCDECGEDNDVVVFRSACHRALCSNRFNVADGTMLLTCSVCGGVVVRLRLDDATVDALRAFGEQAHVHHD
jgi:hypothetical protein